MRGIRMNYISLDEIEEELNFFSKMYDAVRLVDPMHKRVLDVRGSSPIPTQEV